MQGLVDGVRKCDANIFKAGTVGQFVDGIDAFYGDFQNRAISVETAARIVAMRVNGETPDKIQVATQLARLLAANGY